MKINEALKHEIDLVLTDPDSSISRGARRALNYIKKSLEALAQPVAPQPAQHDRVRELECVIADLEAECKELRERRKPLTDELAVLRLVSEEYNAWIHAHAGGGSYDEFLKQRLATHGIKENT